MNNYNCSKEIYMEVQLIVLTSGEKLIGHYELVEDSGDLLLN